MEYALEMKNVCKKYRDFTLADVSFALASGTIMGLIGPNGAGKTTLVKLIMNLIRRDGGEIRVFGLDNIRDEARIKARIGFVYDVPPFYDDVTLKDTQAALAPFYPEWNERSFLALAAEFALPLGKKFKTLSHGMKMKFSLALALSHGADLILMDEPTTGLDPVFRREFLDKLRALMQDEKKSVLFSTHITSDLERIADFVTFISAGRIVFSASRDTLRDNWGVVKGGDELLAPRSRGLFKGLHRGEVGVAGLTGDVAAARREFGQAAVIDRASLDDIMVFLAKGGNHGNRF